MMSDSQSSGEDRARGSASESSGNSNRGNEAPRSAATAGMSDEQLARMLTRKRIRQGSCFCWQRLMSSGASQPNDLQDTLKRPDSVLSLPDSDLLPYALW